MFTHEWLLWYSWGECMVRRLRTRKAFAEVLELLLREATLGWQQLGKHVAEEVERVAGA